MRRTPRSPLRPWLAALALLAACGDSLVDHEADPNVLNPSGCSAGEVQCGSACVAEDAGHCGAACVACGTAGLPDPNAQPACIAQACGFECRPGFLRSGSACRRAVAVSAGFAHTCALLADGHLKCWGANEHGQLGDGTTADSAVPVDVPLAGVTAVAAGFVHTCAVAGVDGQVYCWGDNTTGSLGDGTTTRRTAPVLVGGLPGPASAIAAGGGETGGGPSPAYYGHSCAIVAAGPTPPGAEVWCWGSNDSGQLGDGTFTQSPAPAQVKLNVSAGAPTALGVGDRHTCAVVNGATWCWGAAGSWQLGNGSTSDQANPVQAQLLPSGATATALAAGAAHTCAVAGGALECWGSNSSGQSAGGDNSSVTVQHPTQVALPTPGAPGAAPSAVAAGDRHTCVVDTAGAVVCFGGNDQSQLSGAATPRGLVSVSIGAVRASPGTGSLAAGFDHTCALLADGGLQCWGANDRGQLGIGVAGAAQPAPRDVSGR